MSFGSCIINQAWSLIISTELRQFLPDLFSVWINDEFFFHTKHWGYFALVVLHYLSNCIEKETVSYLEFILVAGTVSP